VDVGYQYVAKHIKLEGTFYRYDTFVFIKMRNFLLLPHIIKSTVLSLGLFSATLMVAQPTITSVTVSADNSSATVTFSEGVTNNGGGALTAGDLIITINPGTLTTVASVVHLAATSSLTINFNTPLAATPDGTETITVKPATATSVKNGTMVYMATTETGVGNFNDKTLPTDAGSAVFAVSFDNVDLDLSASEPNVTVYYILQPASDPAPSQLSVAASINTLNLATSPLQQNLGGLTPATDYVFYYVLVDNSLNVQTTLYTLPFTTLRPSITVTSVPDTGCDPTKNGSITIATVDYGVITDYDYIIENQTDLSTTALTSPEVDFTGLLGGVTYKVSGSGTGFDLDTVTVALTNESVNPVSSVVTLTHSTSCEIPNGLIALDLNGGTDPAGHKILWKKNGAANAFAANVLQIDTLSGGSYRIEITNTATSCFAIVSAILEDHPTPADFAEFSGPTDACEGVPFHLVVDVSGGKPQPPYIVSIDNGVDLVSNYQSGDSISVIASASTTYNLLWIKDVNSCTPLVYGSTTADVTISPIPNAPTGVSFSNVTKFSFKISWTKGTGTSRVVVIKEGSAVDVFPESNLGYNASATFGAGDDIGNGNFVVYNGSLSTVNVSGLKEGTTYHVAVFDANGKCYSTALTGSQLTAGCLEFPDAIATPSSEIICDGDLTNISLSSTDPAATFSWTVVSNGVSGAANGTGAVIAQQLILQSAAKGSVKYIITPKSGVCSGDTTLVIVEVEPPPLTFSITGGGSVCEGSGNTVPLGLDGSEAGMSYVLFRDSVQVETLAGTGGALAFTNTDVPGNYTIEAVRSLGCATAMSGTAFVIVDPLPVFGGVISGPATVCTGESAQQYSVEGPGGLTYNWIFPAGFIITSGEGTSLVTVDLETTASGGQATVSATNSCGTTQPIVLDLTVNQGFDITIIPADTIYAGKETSFVIESLTSLSGADWDLGDGSQTSGLNPLHTYEAEGEYTVAVLATATDGCTRNAEIVVPVGKLAEIIIRNVVTPNGDDQNDFLYIDNISFYPGHEGVVLDRWGIKIKSFTDYQNDWDLTTDNGEVLPAGNYLCLVKIPGKKLYSMVVTVITE